MFVVLSNGMDVLWHHLGMFKIVIASLLLLRVHLKQRIFVFLPIDSLSNRITDGEIDTQDATDYEPHEILEET
ncbi:hypothetical protein AVEN_44947-1 [Araneus ventricosus]|uniref:Uncharacterized protein n=1 Tax=Araneus ventricosus TaxID=182803 RepID=A0A4Y2SEQ7_ARAVE|nr:hypothetical protein AVEN_44947-1 [Araneus ventricosus]